MVRHGYRAKVLVGGESSPSKCQSSVHARQEYSSSFASASKGGAKHAYVADRKQYVSSNADTVAFEVILMLGMRR